QLVPRLYDVTEGRVLVNGVDVRDWDMDLLRSNIGYVPQRGVLFRGDIESNLRFGAQDADFEQIEKAASIAQAAEFINQKEDGYQSEIAQGGTNVSGGQKQRLCIARALATGAPVLVFDDSFSALDFKTDAALRAALKQNTQNACVLLVAQRVGSIISAEQIVVLDEGRVAGIGTHAQLMENCPVYREIAESQLSKEELENV
ncbi:MAG: ABC transporter ATP-binding protein, partial [Oscillospiraceae bacterium]|nr:ABC transporter ATP-binding protein [Oscillospiraceae bacterium]